MKLKLLFTLLLASFFTLAQVPTNGLVKEYDFTYGSGNQYLNSNVQSSLQSGLVDLIKSGSNAAFTEDRNNNINSALQLNGDYLYSGGTEQTYVNAYTISFWIKSTTIDNANSKFIIHQKGNSPVRGLSVELYNGQLQFYNVFGYGNTSITDVNTVYVTSSINVADGNWHHVVCAVNSTASSTVFAPYVAWTINYYSKMYIDNYLVGNANQTVVPSYTNGQLVREAINRMQPFYIGSYPGNTNPLQKYTDQIDQVKYYERELSVAEIGELYYEEHPQSPIYVDVNASGNNDGTSWANAYTNLQLAITNNPFRDDIWVAQGIYTPSGSGRNSTFLIDKKTKIYGGFNGTETTLEQRDFRNNLTILNGDVNGNDNSNINPSEATRSENLYHIVTVKGDPRIVVIDGFYLSGANANGTTLTSGTASAQYLHNRGGALFLHSYLQNTEVDLNVSNCVFEKNSATDTSVFSNWYSTGVNSMYQNIYFTSCIFKNNYATQNAHVLFLSSGGYAQMTTGKIINCLLHNNTTINGPAGLYFFASTANGGNGSSMSCQILNTTISNNSGINGSVIRVDNTNNVHARNSIIWGNGSNTPITKNNAIFSCIYSNIEQGAQNGGSNTDPLLDSNYKLTSLSVAINTGINSNLPAEITTDLAGNNRFVDTDVDLGAYEYDAALSNSDFNSTKAFTIYPNPTNGDLYIQYDDEIAKVILYSLDGRVLLETQNTYLQIHDLPSGLYIVSLENNVGKKSIQKIVKK